MKNSYSTKIESLLKQLRKARGSMSQPAFAYRIGVKLGTLENWEQRRAGKSPSTNNYLKIVKFLDELNNQNNHKDAK